MSFVILQPCCNDASCIDVCPVDCIHPTPAEASFMRTEMLHIDPQTCIDCGACAEACPVDAIKAEEDLEEADQPYLALNAEYFDRHPVAAGALDPVKPVWRKADYSGLRVAVVGSGPAACYAALEIVAHNGARVEMFDRLISPYGLVRFGVAPDHPGTKEVTNVFKTLARKKNFHLNLGVEVGSHITHSELLEHHHAVVYAVGASADRQLGVAGEDLPGSHAATEFVAWYNGHPDYADRTFDLSAERAVVIGNGNVALDVARILLTDSADLERTDIADHALEVLRNSNVREVVVLGRRGVAQAGYTNPEMLALRNLPGVDVIIDESEVGVDEVTQALLDAEDTEPAVRSKVRFAQEVAATPARGLPKRLVLRYLTSPTEIAGTDHVEAVVVSRNRLEQGSDGIVRAVATGATETIETGLVLRAVGYRGVAVPDLPFDDSRGVIPNAGGRVLDPDSGAPIPGVYVAGWIKRGPSGVIGTNKKCATDTVDLLLQDYLAGSLPEPGDDAESLAGLVAERQPDVVDFAGWTAIDKAERAAGKERGRPRVKFIDATSMLDIARVV